MNVVYIIGHGSKHNDIELKISLRSLKYIPDLKDVYLIGHKPEWCNGVIHLPYEDIHESKDRNIMCKLSHYIEQSNGEPFLKFSDDFVMLKAWNPSDYKMLHTGDYNKWRKRPQTKWVQRLLYTMRLFIKDGIDSPYNYDTHTPMIIEPESFMSCMEKYNDELDNVTWGTLYGNYSDHSRNEHMRHSAKFLDSPRNFFQLLEQDITFMSYNEYSLNQQLADYLLHRLGRSKSIYEV